jgi:hypothetical protein
MKRTLPVVSVLALMSVALSAQAPSATESLGSVRLSRAVMADGKPLAAGVYTVRLTSEEPAHAIGQSPNAERWVEFVRNGSVAGREVATVISASDMRKIAKSPQPSANGSRVDLLRGGDYLRAWINRRGMNYLINFRVSKGR